MYMAEKTDNAISVEEISDRWFEIKNDVAVYKLKKYLL